MPTPSHCKNCLTGIKCSCGVCHSCKQKWIFYPDTPECSHPPLVGMMGQTQKVRGLRALSQQFYSYILPILQVLPLTAVEEDIETPYPTFARPCPLTPRHGFVESRVVEGWDELKRVLDETKEADPEGEVMLVDYIHALYNAVWVPSLLTVGEGNEGATLGINTHTFPLAGIIDPRLQGILPQAGINPTTDDPYIEVVYPPHPSPYKMTQLRAGPKLGGSGVDYLPPLPMTVKHIIKVDPKMELIEWERTLAAMCARQNEIGEDGTVVWHPGGSPTDHFSVHARTFHIPVCITFPPSVGMTIVSPLTTPPLDPMGVLMGIAVGQTFPLRHEAGKQNGVVDAENAINLVLHTLHHSSAIGGEHSWWLGVGVALMLRYGAIALRGEARHIKSYYGSRDTVYAKSLSHTLQRHRTVTPPLVNVLRYGTFNGSVGGIKWARCGKALGKLFDAVGILAANPTAENCDVLMRAFNFAVNQAHNGGWWLNKFISGKAFQQVQEGMLEWTMKLPPLLWRLGEVKESISPEKAKTLIKQWAKWQPLSLAPVRVEKAILTMVPGLSGLTFKITDRLLKGSHLPVVVDMGSLVSIFPRILKGELFVETTPDGLQVVVQPPHSDPIVVWKEKGIDEI